MISQMSEDTRIEVSARDYVDSEGSIVESARILAEHVRELTGQESARQIDVSFAGLKGLTSSYFTMFLRIMLDEFDVTTFNRRIHCGFDSSLQQSVFQRSWEAIRKEAA